MHGLLRHVGRVATFVVLGALVSPAGAAAQYFGRNKVQYDDFDFRVLRTSSFDIHFYPEEAEAVRDAARMAERWNDRLGTVLEHELSFRRPIILYANHPDFQQTNVIGGFISEGTGGVTEGLRSRVVLPFTGIYETTDHVLGHELVHAYQYDIAGQGEGGISTISRVPLWVVEGMAEYLSVGRVDAHTAMWLRDALLRDDLPTLDQLTRDPRFFPYRFGQAFWAYVAGRDGDAMVNTLFRASLQLGMDEAIPQVLGVTADSLSREWIADIRSAYAPVLEGRQLPAQVGAPILTPGIDAGEMNVGPAVSPDGEYVIFLSEIGLFTIDLYLANARTGEVIRKVASSQSDAHIDALSFIESAGTWSPDGRRFAFVVIAEGDNQLAIADVGRGAIERRISIRGVTGLRDPDWSPDGREIVLTGIEGGRSDLYVVDVATGEPRRLTSDAYAEIQPTWSPDGRTIAFATDRGAPTDLELLTYAPLRLATIDRDGGAVRTLEVFEGAKHIDPQYAPDGASLYFVSDPDGIPNIYRVDLSDRTVYRVTDVATGISGITAEAPAITVARNGGRLLFSVFTEGNYLVHGMEAAEAQGTPVGEAVEGPVARAEVLPPLDALGQGTVARYLEDPATGLPPLRTAEAAAAGIEGEWSVRDYSPGLELLYLGSPTVGVGVNQYGTALGGSISGYFSDILGDRELFAAVAAQGSFKDVGGQVVYMDRDSRWNWGAAASHIPYLSISTVSVVGGTPGQPVQVGDTVDLVQFRQRLYVDQLQGLLQYPFSTTRRVEFQGGYTRYGFGFERLTQTVRRLPGGFQLLDERTDDFDPGGFDPLHFFEGSAALVGDNSFFGFTSPVQGGRYRFEAGGTVGSLSYGTLLADWRRYLFRNPLTFAMRGLHFGRYGGDSDSGRLQSLYLGYPTLIRGYDVNSFELSECTQAEGTNCAEFDRLVGSKLAVANLEVRFPLFGVERYGLIPVSFLPVELAGFLDAGVAWTGEDSPEFEFARESTARIPVVSTGASARVNLLGYAVVEIFYAYPFQRPDKGWHWGFNLAPGW